MDWMVMLIVVFSFCLSCWHYAFNRFIAESHPILAKISTIFVAPRLKSDFSFLFCLKMAGQRD